MVIIRKKIKKLNESKLDFNLFKCFNIYKICSFSMIINIKLNGKG